MNYDTKSKPTPTFTQAELEHTLRALDMAIASNKRATSTRAQPEFKAIYDKNVRELELVKAKLTGTMAN
jgi:hypothetical protein